MAEEEAVVHHGAVVEDSVAAVVLVATEVAMVVLEEDPEAGSVVEVVDMRPTKTATDHALLRLSMIKQSGRLRVVIDAVDDTLEISRDQKFRLSWAKSSMETDTLGLLHRAMAASKLIRTTEE